MAEGGDEEVKAGLVRAGAVHRLKSLRDDAKEQAARLRAGHTAQEFARVALRRHPDPGGFRGILHRLRAEEGAGGEAREEKEAKEAMEAKMREAAGGGGRGGTEAPPRGGEDINRKAVGRGRPGSRVLVESHDLRERKSEHGRGRSLLRSLLPRATHRAVAAWFLRSLLSRSRSLRSLLPAPRARTSSRAHRHGSARVSSIRVPRAPSLASRSRSSARAPRHVRRRSRSRPG